MARIETFAGLIKDSGQSLPAVPSRIHQKESAVWQSILPMGSGSASWKTRDFANFAKEGYTQNADVYACVNWITSACKGIAWKVYKGDDQQNVVKKGPLVDLIRRPNPRQGWSSFIENAVGYLLVAGNSYIERVGPRPGAPPRELYVQRPDRMRVLPGDPRNPIRGYEYLGGSQMPPWLPDTDRNGEAVQKILHLKFFHPLDDWYGLSPIEAAARNVDQNNEAQAWNVALLQNKARPSGALFFKSGLTDDQREATKTNLAEKYSGRANAGRPLVVEGDGEWTEMGLTPVEMDWLAGIEASTLKICAALKVPPELIGDSKGRTYSNFEQARKAGYMEAALPLLDFLVDELNYWLTPFFGEDLKLGYDRNDIEAIQEDRQLIWDRALKSFQAGGITLNEYRKMIGEDETPDGDVFYIPTTMVPMSLDGRRADIAPVPEPQPVKPPLAARDQIEGPPLPATQKPALPMKKGDSGEWESAGSKLQQSIEATVKKLDARRVN